MAEQKRKPSNDHFELILEMECVNFARSFGVVAVKLENNGHKGIPDRLFIKNGGKTLYVEFKRPKNAGSSRVSDVQEFWKEFLGDSCAFIYSFDEFKQKFIEFFEFAP